MGTNNYMYPTGTGVPLTRQRVGTMDQRRRLDVMDKYADSMYPPGSQSGTHGLAVAYNPLLLPISRVSTVDSQNDGLPDKNFYPMGRQNDECFFKFKVNTTHTYCTQLAATSVAFSHKFDTENIDGKISMLKEKFITDLTLDRGRMQNQPLSKILSVFYDRLRATKGKPRQILQKLMREVIPMLTLIDDDPDIKQYREEVYGGLSLGTKAKYLDGQVHNVRVKLEGEERQNFRHSDTLMMYYAWVTGDETQDSRSRVVKWDAFNGQGARRGGRFNRPKLDPSTPGSPFDQNRNLWSIPEHGTSANMESDLSVASSDERQIVGDNSRRRSTEFYPRNSVVSRGGKSAEEQAKAELNIQKYLHYGHCAIFLDLDLGSDEVEDPYFHLKHFLEYYFVSQSKFDLPRAKSDLQEMIEEQGVNLKDKISYDQEILKALLSGLQLSLYTVKHQRNYVDISPDYEQAILVVKDKGKKLDYNDEFIQTQLRDLSKYYGEKPQDKTKKKIKSFLSDNLITNNANPLLFQQK